jgi:SAM-dependent methyltransferase
MNRTQWNRLADEFETEVCDIAREGTDNQLKRLVGFVELSPKNSVLVDLGCGLGTFIRKFHNRFDKITGVEFAPRIIARAKKNCAKVPRTRWLTMPIPQSAKTIGTVADLTVCMNVITSPKLAERRAIWKAIANVTKPNGYALIVVPSLESEHMVQQVSGEALPTELAGGLVQRDDAVQKHFERRELEPILARYGFAPVRIGRIYYRWAKEGMRKPRAATSNPWDWVCLAQRRGVRSAVRPVSTRPMSAGSLSRVRSRRPRSGSAE